MAKKPTPKKGAAKKPAAVVKKASPAAKAKPTAKTQPAVKKPNKPAPVAKPVAKPSPAKNAALATKAPQAAKPAAPPAAAVAPKPAPAPAKPVAAAVASTETPAGKPSSGSVLTVSAQSSAGAAQNGGTQPANLLVVVTQGGWPVVDLHKDDFTVMEHFEVPGQSSPFSNNVTSFRNAGTGAYLLQIRPINAAPWRSGHHLGQILISTADNRQGQVAFKLIVR